MIVNLTDSSRIAFHGPSGWHLQRRVFRRAHGSSDLAPSMLVFSGVEECPTFAMAWEAAARRGLAPSAQPPDLRSAQAVVNMIVANFGATPPPLAFGYCICAQESGQCWLFLLPPRDADQLLLGVFVRPWDAFIKAVWHRAFSRPGEVALAGIGGLLLDAALALMTADAQPATAAGCPSGKGSL